MASFLLATLILLFFILIAAKGFSQNAVTANRLIYLDSMWVPATQENYKYTRLIEEYYSEKKTYIYKDYYKSGKIKFIATTTDRDIMKIEGQAVSYYENGNKKSTGSKIIASSPEDKNVLQVTKIPNAALSTGNVNAGETGTFRFT